MHGSQFWQKTRNLPGQLSRWWVLEHLETEVPNTLRAKEDLEIRHLLLLRNIDRGPSSDLLASTSAPCSPGALIYSGGPGLGARG